LVTALGLSGLLRAGDQTEKEKAEKAAKTLQLGALYKAYAAYEIKEGKPAKKVEELSLGDDNVKLIKSWFVLDELGLSLVNFKKEDAAKMAMVYEKQAQRNGGLVLFYDGSIRTLSAAEVKKLVAKDK
jgi:hypothetical protein